MSGTSDTDQKARADAEKAQADADQARTAATKSAQELAEWDSEIARRGREAASQKAIIDAQSAATDEVAKAVSTYVPDLSKVDRGSLTTSGTALYGGVVAQAALGQAAKMVKKKIDEIQPAVQGSVLIVSDGDLVASDAAYVEVATGMDRLQDAVVAALAATTEDGQLETVWQGAGVAIRVDTTMLHRVAAVPVIAAAAASVLPPILSLFSARRTLSGEAVTVDQSAAIASIADTLRGPNVTVSIDRFRLVPTSGPLLDEETKLAADRVELATRQRLATRHRLRFEAAKADAQERVDDARKRLAAATDDAHRDSIAEEIQRARDDREAAVEAAAQAADVEAMLTGVIDAVEKFLAAIRTVPADGLSPLVAALLREGLRTPTPAFDWVLFVGSVTGSTNQLFNDLPLWFKDRFAVVGSVTLPFWLLNPRSGALAASGTGLGTAQLQGKVGGDVSITQVQSGG